MARILIAEDEAGLRALVARALSLDGHDVITANDGAEALELIVRTQGAFDLLLSDIRMPVMDGIALALATARDHPHVGILLMTGYADQRERASGLDALIHDVITKPFSLGQIDVVLQRIRDRVALEAENRRLSRQVSQREGVDARTPILARLEADYERWVRGTAASG